MRRLDILSGPQTRSYTDHDDKRVFEASYLVRVSSELIAEQVAEFNRVQQVVIDLTIYQHEYGPLTTNDTGP